MVMNERSVGVSELHTSTKELIKSIFPQKDECIYTKCYCEENVWMLCNHVLKNHKNLLQQFYVIFVSNENKAVPLWAQKSRTDITKPVIWDYHALLLFVEGSEYEGEHAYILDLDSVLPFPTKLSIYCQEAFRPDILLKTEFKQYLKLIPADTYLKTFSSDRSHMKKAEGDWFFPPPSYECIFTEQSTMNLNEFMDMSQSLYGTVYSVKDFMKAFNII
ncbi:protein N-terminal glutamine amidohydrolase-like [Clavelina lepadiformis]|uniref:Protein N-terminal glutamine amidohydrolase n=1 Tax=Clavelina lepadiformis TaxID=159417 RepID=A0ABP0H436_CLALP